MGHNFDRDGPVTGRRKKIIRFIYTHYSTLLLRGGLAMKVNYKYHKEYDYTEYLGTDYKRT